MSTDDATERRRSRVAAIAVAALLALLSGVQIAAHQRATEYLLLPPFAVIIYLIFRAPWGESANFRSIVLLPAAGALVGQYCGLWLGMTPQGVAAAALGVLLIQWAMRAHMPPSLALAVLAMLLRVEGETYVLGVVEGTLVIFVAFALWRRLGPSGWL